MTTACSELWLWSILLSVKIWGNESLRTEKQGPSLGQLKFTSTRHYFSNWWIGHIARRIRKSGAAKSPFRVSLSFYTGYSVFFLFFGTKKKLQAKAPNKTPYTSFSAYGTLWATINQLPYVNTNELRLEFGSFLIYPRRRKMYFLCLVRVQVKPRFG